MSNRTIERSRNYVSRGKPRPQPGTYVDFIDSAGLVERQTIVRVTHRQEHVNSNHLPEVAPAKQIKDSLTGDQFEALGEYVAACMLCYGKFKTTDFQEAVDSSRSLGGLPLRQHEFNQLHMYRYISDNINPEYRDFLDGFSAIVEADVGQVRERRKQAMAAMYDLGDRIVRRSNKSVQIAGLSGYLKALATELVWQRKDYLTLLQRKRAEARMKWGYR